MGGGLVVVGSWIGGRLGGGMEDVRSFWRGWEGGEVGWRGACLVGWECCYYYWRFIITLDFEVPGILRLI